MSQIRKTVASFARCSATIATIALAMTGGARADYINDGGFETPDLHGAGFMYSYDGGFNPGPGVTFFGNSGIDASQTFSIAPAPEGSQVGFIQSGTQDANGLFVPTTITFDVTGLTASATYRLSFEAAPRGGYPVNPIDVSFNALLLGGFAPDPAATDFQTFTTSFVATGTTGSLQVLGTAIDSDYDTALDDIVVTMVSSGPPTVPVAPIGTGTVPEPAPIALLGLGIVAGGLARRRAQRAGAA